MRRADISSLRRCPTLMLKCCVSCSTLRLNSERLKSRLRLRARRQRKSSTSWPRLRRVCKQKDGPRGGTSCGGEWASPRRGKSQGAEQQDPDQARVGRRIEQGGGFRGRVCLRRAEAY